MKPSNNGWLKMATARVSPQKRPCRGDKDTQLGSDLIEAMREVAAWKRGEIALSVREVDPMPAARRLANLKRLAARKDITP